MSTKSTSAPMNPKFVSSPSLSAFPGRDQRDHRRVPSFLCLGTCRVPRAKEVYMYPHFHWDVGGPPFRVSSLPICSAHQRLGCARCHADKTGIDRSSSISGAPCIPGLEITGAVRKAQEKKSRGLRLCCVSSLERSSASPTLTKSVKVVGTQLL